MTQFVMGPAVCKSCKRFVYLATDATWRDSDGLRHVCPSNKPHRLWRLPRRSDVRWAA